MTAKEARALMQEMDKVSLDVRKNIDEEIRKAATNGLRNTTVSIYKTHPSEKVKRSLLKDGFGVSCKYHCDCRDGDIYTYCIDWVS